MDPAAADPANKDQDPASLTTGDGAENESTQQPAGDSATPRSTEQGQAPEATADDASQETTDPLILAQLEPEQTEEPAKPAAPPAAKPTATAPPKPAAPQGKAPEKPAEPAAPEKPEDDPIANLPDEDWQKLSHKGKSQYLSQRRAIQRLKQESEAKANEAKAAREEADLHEKLFRDTGLTHEDYHNGINVVAAVTRGDPDALPILEQTLKNLRTRLGVKDPTPPPTPAAPAVDADELLMLVEEAEGTLEFSKLRERVTKLKSSQQPTPPPAAPPAPPAAPPTPAPPAARTAPALGDAEVVVNTAIGDFLVAEGTPADQVIPYLRELVQDIAAEATRQGRPMPNVQERLRAVMAAHRARKAKAAQPPPKPAPQPLSGRGRPVVTSRPPTSTNADPLKHAVLPGR